MMEELYITWDIFQTIASNTDVDCLKACLCMLIDYTAVKSGVSSKELLEQITPIIIQCNEELGEMAV